MIGLSLAGGGTRGSYQVGAYYALKKCHIKIDGFVGTSIGSFNAAMLAAGKEKELLQFWNNINVGQVIGFDKKYIEEINSKQKSTSVFTHILKNIKNFILNKGFNSDGLKMALNELNIEEDLRKSKKDFGLVTVRAKDYSPIYKFKEDIPIGKLNDYILASCYLPIFKKEKLIDDSYYLDGGFYDNNPVNMLLDKGYSKVYSVDLSAIGIKRKIKDKDKVIIIKPSHDLKSILNTNVEDIKYNIKLGYYDTIKILKEYDGSKYIFKVFNNWIYEWVIRKVNCETREKMEILFGTKNAKTLVIKSIENVMSSEHYEYTKIYNPIKIIKELKKNNKKYGIHKFINELRLF